LLTLSHVSKSFDDRPALVDVSCTIESGSRTALVGVNGSGKSTLLRIVAGEESPDTGTVRIPPGTSLTYLPQDYGLAAAMTVGEYLADRAGLLVLERRLRALEAALEPDGGAGLVSEYADALERYANLGGYELAGRIDQALTDVRLPSTVIDRPIGELSGGQQVRVALAGVLASRHDLYLLDEPTNNLDLPSLDLLERFVTGTAATFLLVSHDRAFLDAVATDVVELDEHDHTATAYGVSYAQYRRLRAAALAARSAGYQQYLAEAERLTAAVRAKRAAAARTKDTRPPRDHDKLTGHFLAQRKARQAGRVMRHLERRLERLEAAEEPRSGWELRLSLVPSSRSGDRVLDVREAVKRYGDFTLGPVSLSVGWRDRIAVQGHNGSGKTMLVSLLTGEVAPDEGEVRRGHGVVVGVLRQGGVDMSGGGDSALQVFQRAVDLPGAQARTLLAKFDLGADHVLRPLDSCSPGERCRLGLAILMARGANLLVLDEPTNHLDLEAQEELEQALVGFDGTLLVVSHDREFLDRIGVARRWELEEGGLVCDEPA
jgi:ATPase subunit of ABC transporter with duplicated ATPase domains